MAIKKSEKIWHNGQFIPWDEAKIHVLSHVVSYGTSVFEGIRCYQLPRWGRGSSVCGNTCSVCSTRARSTVSIFPFLWTIWSGRAIELVQVNAMQHCYIRPIHFARLQ